MAIKMAGEEDNKIYFSFELFKLLPAEKADKLQEELMITYFKGKEGELRDIIERSGGDTDLYNVYKEEEFQRKMSTDYAYDINILRSRKDDELAQRLVEAIDDYNNQVQKQENLEEKKASIDSGSDWMQTKDIGKSLKDNYIKELESIDKSIKYLEEAISQSDEKWEKKEYRQVLEDTLSRKVEIEEILNKWTLNEKQAELQTEEQITFEKRPGDWKKFWYRGEQKITKRQLSPDTIVIDIDRIGDREINRTQRSGRGFGVYSINKNRKDELTT